MSISIISKAVAETKKMVEGEDMYLYAMWQITGMEDYYNRLVVKCMRLVFKIAGKYKKIQFVSYDDLVSAGTEGLIRGIVNFDSSKGVAIKHYLCWWIRAYVWKAIDNSGVVFHGKHSDGKEYNEVRLDKDENSILYNALFTDDGKSISDVVAKHTASIIKDFMAKNLSVNEAYAISHYFGLYGNREMDTTEIATNLKCTRQAVYFHIKNGLTKIRKNFA